jgi:hypothetical protein
MDFHWKSVVSRWAGQTSNLVGVASNPWWVRLPYSSANQRDALLAVPALRAGRKNENEGPRLVPSCP